MNTPVHLLWDVVNEPENWASIFYGLSVDQRHRTFSGLAEDSRYSFTVKGNLPYSLKFQVRVLKLVEERLVQVKIVGDLKGSGRVETVCEGEKTKITFNMSVVPVKCWMRLTAPAARHLFIKNHNRIVNKSYDSLRARVAKAAA